MKKVLYTIWFIAILVASNIASAQVTKEAQNLLDEARRLMLDSSYAEANQKFIQAINTKSVLPDEFCFYFGVNLYNTKNVAKSIALLEMYIQVTGKEGLHYTKSLYYLNMLQPKNTTIVTNTNTGDTTNIKYDEPEKPAPCNENDVIICPICEGTGVIVTKSSFGESFQSCNFSDEHGHMDCEHFKLYMLGTPKKY